MNETQHRPKLTPGQLVRASRRLPNGWTREYRGILARELEVDAPLVLILDSSRLMTSAICSLRNEADAMVIETQHSTYTVHPIEIDYGAAAEATHGRGSQRVSA